MNDKKTDRNSGRHEGNSEAKKVMFLWRWQVILPVLSGLLMLFLGWFWGSQDSKDQIEHWRTQADHWKEELNLEKKKLEYSSEPNFALRFVSPQVKGSDKAHFELKNLGPGRLDDIWLKETIFLVDSSGVHECLDLPHFEYFYFCGQPASMGTLSVNEHRRIDLSPCWSRPFNLFFQQFSGILVSRYRLTGTAVASPEFRKDFFFIIENKGIHYTAPHEYVGGKVLLDSIIEYTHRGPRSIIRWVCFAHHFFKNPPRYFWQPEGDQFIPWFGSGLPPKSPAGIPVFFSKYTILPTKGGSAKLVWDCEQDGPIASMGGCNREVW